MASITRVAEDAAQEVLRASRVVPEPPVDVVEVARRLGADVVSLPTPGDGMLLVEPELRIVVDPSSGRQRRRFTIAHEIGHLWLSRTNAFVPKSRLGSERFCDVFAADLLLPRHWIGSWARHAPRTLSSLRKLSYEADVSLSACLLRLQATSGWRLALLHWERTGERWRLKSVVGGRLDHGERVRSATATEAALRSSRSMGRTLSGVWLPLVLGDRLQYVSAEVHAVSSGAIVLADLSTRRRSPAPIDASCWHFPDAPSLFDH